MKTETETELTTMGRVFRTNDVSYNSDYCFLKWFEVIRTVNSDVTTFDVLFNAISKSCSKEDFADILLQGIKAQFKEKNDFKLISQLHDSLKDQSTSINKQQHSYQKIAKTTNVVAVKRSCYSSNRVFCIQSLLCNIFQYLDFHSFIHCRKVNLQW